MQWKESDKRENEISQEKERKRVSQERVIGIKALQNEWRKNHSFQGEKEQIVTEERQENNIQNNKNLI